MFVFIDESGLTDVKSNQKYLVVSFALMNNRAFAENLILEIRDKCKAKGKPIKKREVKFHDLEPLQKEIAIKTINSRYRNFYVCFVDLEKMEDSMVTGSSEHEIQTRVIHAFLANLDKGTFNRKKRFSMIMDKKLSKRYQESIRQELQCHFGTKKGISVDAILVLPKKEAFS